MLKRIFKIYILVTPILFCIDWLVGAARFHWPFFKYLFAVINFPCIVPFLWLEGKPSIWWNDIFGSSINDEIGQGIVFLVMVVLQSVFYTALILLFTKRLHKGDSPAILCDS